MSISKLQNSYINNKYNKYGFFEAVNVGNFLPVIFKDIDISIVNGLRRILMTEVKNVAFAEFDNNSIEKIQIKKNTSQYHHEVLIDRFGYIIINMDFIEENNYNINDLKFVICGKSIDSPLKNMTSSILEVVVHQHIIALYQGQQIDITKICPFNSLLLTLHPTEEIHVAMSPCFGIGKKHTRWQSSYVMYKFVTQNDLGSNTKIETNEELMNYFGHESKKANMIILTIESNKKMSSINVLVKGIQVLKEKLELTSKKITYYASQMENEKSAQMDADLQIEYDTSMPTLIKIKLINEDYTLAHILEFMTLKKIRQLINKTVAEITTPNINKEKEEMEMLQECLCGYKKKHPLENTIELIVRTPIKYDFQLPQNHNQFLTPIEVLLIAIEETINLCNTFLSQIEKFE